MKYNFNHTSIAIFAMATLMCSCGSYRYYHPMPNPALFKKAGEVQVAGDIGISGSSAKVALSPTQHLGVMGLYNSGITNYRSRDFELGAGYYSYSQHGGQFLSGGYGWGTNFEYTDSTHTSKKYSGSYQRPFIQWNTGVTGGKLFGGVRGDIVLCIKGSYLSYKGNYETGNHDPIKSQYTVLQMGFIAGIGSRTVQFYVSNAFVFRPAIEPLKSYGNARTFPVTVGVGLKFTFGRGKEEKKTE